MNQRANFLIELLDKLGVPLMNAVQSSAPASDGAPAKEAELMATMLGQSVQLGLSVAGKLDLKEEDGEADAVRLSLSAMAGKLIGDSYRQHGRLPSEADTTRMARALEAVLTFADNFTPSAEHSARLRAVGGEKPLFDLNQSQIFYLSAMEPVLAAVAEFPFGQNEIGLIQSTAEKLHERAKTLREALIGASAEGPESAFAELMILHSLARIYADCHRAETARIAKADENAPPPSLDPVWKGFDLRLSMLEALLNGAVPGASTESAAPTTPSAPAPSSAAATLVEASPETPPAPQETAIQTPPPPPAAAPSAAPPAAGPMGFFAKKPDQTPASEAPDTAQPSSAPAAAPETPSAAPASPPPPPPAADAPPSAPPSSPMGFFKPGVKKAGDSDGQDQ